MYTVFINFFNERKFSIILVRNKNSIVKCYFLKIKKILPDFSPEFQVGFQVLNPKKSGFRVRMCA